MGKLMRINPRGGDNPLLWIGLAAAAGIGLAFLMRDDKKAGVDGLGDLPPFYPWETGPFPKYETTDRAYRQAQILQEQEVNAAGKVILAPGTIQPVQYNRYIPSFNPKGPKAPGPAVAEKIRSAKKAGINGLAGLADAACANCLPCNPYLFQGIGNSQKGPTYDEAVSTGVGSTIPRQHWPAEFEAVNSAYETVC